MSKAPERIWAWEYAGAEGNEGQWRSSKGACPSQAYVIYEYICADHVDALLKAEREKALREAAVICNQSYGGSIGDVHKAILALISEDATDG